MADFVSLFTGMSERDIGYLLKNMVQRQINEELTNSEISSIDNKTPVLLTNSKDIELINDIAIQSVINIEAPTQYIMTEEPDGKDLKVWLKFQNAGELRDWSYQKNKSFSVGSNTMPGLFYRTEENNMLKTELYSYFNGHDHYAYSTDAVPIRILPNITATKITSFFMRLVPISLSRLLASDNNTLFAKVDDDQLRYGYSVTVDLKGNMHFYVRNNYKQYHLFIKNAYNSLVTNPILPAGTSVEPYRFENFNIANFKTNYETLCSMVALEPPFDDWFFKYNPTTHNMSVIQAIENNPASVFADTSLVSELPYLSCPIQEGKYTHSGTVQTTIYDNSGNNNNGTLTGLSNTPGGGWNDDNTLTSLGANVAGDGGGIAIDYGSIASLNTLTEFTISFWFNPLTETTHNETWNGRLVTKGYAAADTIYIERRFGQNDLKFSFRKTDNVEQSVTFPNAFPTANQWYLVTCRWKSGEKLKISVNDTEVESASVVSGTLSTASSTLKLFNATRAATGIMALFKMWNIRINQTTQDDLYYAGYHNPLFPKSENIQPEAGEEQPDIFIPFSNVYTLDKLTTPAAGNYRKINSLAGDNPLVVKYTVADGTSSSDPELLKYDVPDGVTTGGGLVAFSKIYDCTDPSNNSFVRLNSGSDDNAATAVEVTTAGAGSSLNGKKITKAIFYLKGENSPTGSVICKVWNAAGAVVTTLWYNGTVSTNLNAASVNTSTMTAYTFQNTDLTPWGANSMGVGWKVGIEYDGGDNSDTIQVKRNRSNPKTGEWATSRDWDGNWEDNPDDIDDDDLVGELWEGGTGSATVDPWIEIGSGSPTTVTELFGSTTHNLLNQLPRKITLRLKKTGTPTGSFTVSIMNTSGTQVAQFTGGTLTANSLTTSFADYTYTNLVHNTPITNGMMISVNYAGTGGKVCVMTNLGNTTASNPNNTGGTNNYHSSTSYARRYQSGVWTNLTTQDVSMKVYTGGTTFNAYVRLSATRTRVATKAVNSSSSIHNQKITKIKARIKKVGAPGGIINCYIKTAGDVTKVTFSSVDVSTITADGTYKDVIFENYSHSYLINSTAGSTSGDKIVYEFAGSDASNYLEFNANSDVLDTSTLSTITQTYDSGSYVDDAQHDLAGNMWGGGEPDLSSRTRVAQSIEHQDSRLKGKKITRVKAFLYRTTSNVSGTVYCNIRRGSDDSLVKTLDTVAASTLSTNPAVPTQPVFDDVTNNYPMTVGDKVCIEFSGGNATDAVGVLIRESAPNYDLANSYVRKFDELDWDDEETAFDLCAVMDEGGFFYTPDPDAIPDPTPINDKDLIICAGNNKLSGFFETFLMEFRIYTKDITTDMADNLYANRYSISPISPNAIHMPFSFKCNSLDPV